MYVHCIQDLQKEKVRTDPPLPHSEGERKANILLIYLQTIGCLMPISTIFELYRGSQFNWWRKPEYSEKTTDRSYVAEKHKQYIFPVE
jgi:hypothetical protein